GLKLMIWPSRAGNGSADPVVSCFFGRIAPSDEATESCFSIRRNRENEFASFQGLRHGNLAISSQQRRQKTTLAIEGRGVEDDRKPCSPNQRKRSRNVAAISRTGRIAPREPGNGHRSGSSALHIPESVHRGSQGIDPAERGSRE